jgi:hypothetical protein
MEMKYHNSMVRMVRAMRCRVLGWKHFYRHKGVMFGNQLLQETPLQRKQILKTNKELKRNNKIEMDFI